MRTWWTLMEYHHAGVGPGLIANISRRHVLTCTCTASCSILVFQPNVLSASPIPLAARSLSTAQPQKADGGDKKQEFDSLELTEEKINAITDKIPQRPVGVVEGTSYSLIIVAAFGVLFFVVWQFIANFILEPTVMQCFNHTLDKLKGDPRITVRIGGADDIRAWGSNSTSRVGRQQVPHQIYKDPEAREHVRFQFHIKGPSGQGLVHADMYKDENKQWQYTYLLVDVYSPNSPNPSRVHIISPK